MVEQVYRFSTTDERAVEKVLLDENVNYLHMVFPRGRVCRSTTQTRTCT